MVISTLTELWYENINSYYPNLDEASLFLHIYYNKVMYGNIYIGIIMLVFVILNKIYKNSIGYIFVLNYILNLVLIYLIFCIYLNLI